MATTQIPLTSPEGVRLLVEGTVCEKNIDVIPTLQEKTITPTTEAQEVVADSGYAGLSTMTVKKIPDKYITPEWDGTFTVTGEPTTGGDDGLNINGIIKQYQVNAGATVNAGDFVEFVNKGGSAEFCTTTANYISACKLDNSRVLVAWGYSSYLRAVVLTMDSTTVTAGATVQVSGQTPHLSVVALTDSKALVAYSDKSNANYRKAVILTIDGDIITVGEAVTFNTSGSSCTGISATALTDSKVFVAFGVYSSSNYYGYVTVLTIDDTTIIPSGTTSSFYSSGSSLSDFKVISLATDKVFLCAYANTSTYGNFARVYKIDGTTVSAGAQQIMSTTGGTYVSATALTDSKVIMVYTGVVSSKYAFQVAILAIDGTTITLKTTYTAASSTQISYQDVVTLSENTVLIVYTNVTKSNKGYATALTIDGYTVKSRGTDIVFEDLATSFCSLVAFSDNSAMVFYNNSSAGKFKSFLIDGTTITDQEASEYGGTFVQPATSNLHNVGVAKTSGAEGETVEVYCVQTNEGV